MEGCCTRVLPESVAALAKPRPRRGWGGCSAAYVDHVPEVHGKVSWQRHRTTQCYREIAERTRKVPLLYTPALTVHIPDRRSVFLLRGRRPMRLRATRELRLRLNHERSDKYHAVRSMLNDLRKRPPYLETPNSAWRSVSAQHPQLLQLRQCSAAASCERRGRRPCR